MNSQGIAPTESYIHLQIQSMGMEMSRLTRDGTAKTISRETKFSGANGDRDIFIFPVQLTASRIGNLTRLIHTLAICDKHTYIYYISSALARSIPKSRWRSLICTGMYRMYGHGHTYSKGMGQPGKVGCQSCSWSAE